MTNVRLKFYKTPRYLAKVYMKFTKKVIKINQDLKKKKNQK